MKNLLYICLILVVVGVIIGAQKEKWAATPSEQPEIVADIASDTPATEVSDSLINVSAPSPNESVGNPLEVSGTARGYWFFEASAPVVVTNWDGLIVGEGYITAVDDWMTEDYVPFSGTIAYELPADTYSATGTLIFKRANPSGLPENDETYEMQVQLQRK